MFTFPARGLGQPAYLSELYARLEAVPGVIGVRVTASSRAISRVADVIPAEVDEWLRLDAQPSRPDRLLSGNHVMSDYPYDDDVLADVARRLYEAVPAMHRLPDEPPTGRGDLQSLLEVLAVPLAVLRQSIQELHADLFIDTADDRMVPYLAEMVGTQLVFPDAESNRRDVRGTVGWRRRKGTPAALEEMGGELTGQSVVLQEGWKRIQLAQDLNLVRADRVVADLRPGIVAEQATGPLDALFHAVDVRQISATTGRHHPRHVAHWLHPTITFPLREATAVDRTLADSDVRYALDPLGERRPLRARRIAGDREPFVDRIQEQHFAATPERWFGQPGGFTVRACGLPGGIAGTERAERIADVRVASRQLGRGDVALAALEQPSRGWRGAVRVELGLVTIAGAGTGSWRPNPATFAARASIDLDAAGVIGSGTAGGSDPGGVRVPMLRLSPLGGAPGRFFPGATLELASAAPGSTAAVEDSQLAREGFLRGVLHVAIPPLEIRGERLLHIAADGSLYEAAQPDGALSDMPEVAGDLQLAPAALLLAGPGAAWPPLLSQAEPRMLNRVPAAPGRGPAVMHGALPLRRTGGGLAEIPLTSRCALAFAVQAEDPGGPAFRPFQRLTWTGRDPRSGTWTALDRSGQPVGAAAVAAEYADVAAQREADPDRVALAVRFECSDEGATLCPGEIAWSADDGRTVLIHLPQLDAEPLAAGAPWPAEATFGFASEAVRVAEDGSTWASESTAGRRVALGQVAPIAEAAGLRRRRVRGRRLCALGPRGLDRIAAGDARADAARAPRRRRPARALRVLRRGAAAALAGGPRHRDPAERHNRLRGGRDACTSVRVPPRASRSSTSAWRARPASSRGAARCIPTHRRTGTRSPATTRCRLRSRAVSARWQALLPADAGDVSEVVQFEDSATYPAEAPVWPAAPADAGDAAVAHDPGRRARAPDRPRRPRPGLDLAGSGATVRIARAARHRPRRHRLDGNDTAAGGAGCGRALQRAAGREPARVRRSAGRNAGHGEALRDGGTCARRRGRPDRCRQHRRRAACRRARAPLPARSRSTACPSAATCSSACSRPPRPSSTGAPRSRTASAVACATAALSRIRRCRACTGSRSTRRFASSRATGATRRGGGCGRTATRRSAAALKTARRWVRSASPNLRSAWRASNGGSASSRRQASLPESSGSTEGGRCTATTLVGTSRTASAAATTGGSCCRWGARCSTATSPRWSTPFWARSVRRRAG